MLNSKILINFVDLKESADPSGILIKPLVKLESLIHWFDPA